MHRYRHSRLAALMAVVLGLTACDDLLQGPGLTENPNSPLDIAATPEQLIIAIQARQFTMEQGQLARSAVIWTQQLSGIFNQQKEWGSAYNFTENDISGHYNGTYLAGGLLDIRKVQELSSDNRLRGIAMVWEGLAMGRAASLWGDVVYSQALDPTTYPQPVLDPQQQVYTQVQAKLDEAIAALTGASNDAYPLDLVFNGNSDRWRRAANTLKARYHLHTAPRLGAAAYQAAITAANSGINEAPTSVVMAMDHQAPGNMRSWHGNTLDDGNIWSQFNEARTDLAANERFVNVLKARNDPRLEQWFQPEAADGEIYGANRFGNLTAAGAAGTLNRLTRVPRVFRQPIATWAENQLILAEAHFQTGAPGTALTHVNNVRTAVGLDPLAGPVTLEQIMVEKWIAQFQNIDVYSDWRRTCYPRLQPGGANEAAPAAAIPGRYPYGSGERLQNTNVPIPSQAPAKNWNHAEITCPTTLADATI